MSGIRLFELDFQLLGLWADSVVLGACDALMA